MSKHHLLMIEDDARLAQMVCEYLAQNSLEVTHVADGQSGLTRLQGQDASPLPDLVILDLMLPDMDGLEVCRRIRSLQGGAAQVPVLMLTAKGDPMDRIIGLELGADDYLPKPFAARELLARVRSVLRRTRMLPPTLAAEMPRPHIRFGAWTLDTVARHLVDAAGTVVALSGAEYRLLRVLLQHPQRILNRDQLLQLTQGRDADVFDRSIDLLVSRVRQRLRDDVREPRYIKTVRSEGYVFASQVEAQDV